MERIVQSYHGILKTFEAMQQAGKLTLGEANAVYTQVVQLKEAIESVPPGGLQAPSVAVAAPAKDNTAEVEDLKVELIARNIALDTAQRNLKAAQDKLKKYEA